MRISTKKSGVMSVGHKFLLLIFEVDMNLTKSKVKIVEHGSMLWKEPSQLVFYELPVVQPTEL